VIRLQLHPSLSWDDLVKTLEGVVGAKVPGSVQLEPEQRLSQCFRDTPVEGRIHLVAEVPPPLGGATLPHALNILLSFVASHKFSIARTYGTHRQ